MASESLVIGVTISFILAFTLFVVLLMYKLFKTKTLHSGFDHISGLTKEQMNSEVQLTPDEQRRWKKNLLIGFIFLTFIFVFIAGSSGLGYWKFVVQGSKTQAMVLGIASRQSGGRHHNTTYTYTLETSIDGEAIKDSYSAGSYHSSKVGDVVDVYVTNGESRELAIASVEDRDPIIILAAVVVYAFMMFNLVQQRKRVESGKVKFSSLPKSMRRSRFAELKSAKIEAPASESSTYTINGSNTPKKGSGDGSDYLA